jgi:hypothetical protein
MDAAAAGIGGKVVQEGAADSARGAKHDGRVSVRKRRKCHGDFPSARRLDPGGTELRTIWAEKALMFLLRRLTGRSFPARQIVDDG